MPKDNVSKILKRRLKLPKKINPPKFKPLKFEDHLSNKRKKRPHIVKPIFHGTVPKLAIALSMANAGEAKARLFGTNYRSYRIGHSVGGRPRTKAVKYTQEQKNAYRQFGKHIGLHLIQPFTHKYQEHGQLGLAIYITQHHKIYHSTINRLQQAEKSGNDLLRDRVSAILRSGGLHTYSKNAHVFEPMVEQAKEFIQMHPKLKSPKLDMTYFWGYYGRKKITTLPQDEIYQKLVRLKRNAYSEEDKERIGKLINRRKKQLDKYEAEFAYYEYKRDIELEKSNPNYNRIQIYNQIIERIVNPSEQPYLKGLYADLTKTYLKGYFEERKALFSQMHNFLEGEELQEYLAKPKDDRPYRGLIQWLITCLTHDDLLDIDATNKWALRRSNAAMHALANSADLQREFARYAARNGLPQTGAELLFEYLVNQFGDPRKTSRSGSPIPELQATAGKSQGKYLRIYQTANSGFIGIEEEQAEADEFGNQGTPEQKMAFKSKIEARKHAISSFRSYLSQNTADKLFEDAIENRKKFNKDKRRIFKK